jgi:hypothetical protein
MENYTQFSSIETFFAAIKTASAEKKKTLTSQIS